MRVIPVIDLMAGRVVRGVAGRRETYRPIESPLAKSSDPVEVAAALLDRFGIADFYLADLDAIAGAMPAFATYEALFEMGTRAIIDAGVGDVHRAEEMAAFAADHDALDGVIVGLESLESLDRLSRFHELYGTERLIFSLDLMDASPRTVIPELAVADPCDIAVNVMRAGVRRLIVLDLAEVGMDSGAKTAALCQSIRNEAKKGTETKVELISGGGVRGPADLEALQEAGCDGVLVASALHDGKLTAEDVSAFDDSAFDDRAFKDGG